MATNLISGFCDSGNYIEENVFAKHSCERLIQNKRIIMHMSTNVAKVVMVKQDSVRYTLIHSCNRISFSKWSLIPQHVAHEYERDCEQS